KRATRPTMFDGRRRPVRGTFARVPHAVAVGTTGAATLDPDAALAGVTTAIDAALRRLGKRSDEVAAVGTSALWHSLLGVDRRGRPTTELFTWTDLRARDSVRALAAEVDPEDFHLRTGCYPH